MAEHLADPKERSVAVAFYCGCFTVTAVFYFLMWWHAARGRRLIAHHVPDEAVRRLRAPMRQDRFCISPRRSWRSCTWRMSLSIVVGLAALYMFPRAGAHAAVKQE